MSKCRENSAERWAILEKLELHRGVDHAMLAATVNPKRLAGDLRAEQ